MVFCNLNKLSITPNVLEVTILILIDGFLQYKDCSEWEYMGSSHNPYFNRWFSAMED